ncbi:unnamed protein product [Paramecium sonneborni]|uniref:Phospholipid scramblase n=1 Tax=Paramecium sonneborni TaxID=65129 RepID=A0A8S1RTL8_9CILI|nr:unnamed protein product [Paramecium sonneborni]
MGQRSLNQENNLQQEIEIISITQVYKYCDIWCPWKENQFDISRELKKWHVTEESNKWINFYCCQQRWMKLLFTNLDDQTQYEGERPIIIIPCSEELMKVKKKYAHNHYGPEIGKIQAVQQICGDSKICEKPCFKIIQDAQTFVITIDKNSLSQYCLRQCCLPHSNILYNIHEKMPNSNSYLRIGSIYVNFQGIFKEYCTRGDLFTMHIPKNLNEETKILLIFGCLQLNYQEYEQMINLP